MYTVKQVAELAGVSIRTLHYYDEIDLLTPSHVGDNGYRYYDDASLMRLQQILLYREIGLELVRIKDILDSPDFDLLDALRSHRALLEEKGRRLKRLLDTVDSTIQHLTGEAADMSKKKLFKGLDKKEQRQYEREARLQYGPGTVNESVRLWNSYSKTKQQAVMDEGNQLYREMVQAVETDIPPQSATVQALLKRWHEHLRYFYEPTFEILRGLGQLYTTDTAFIANFKRLHPDLPEYVSVGITQYVDDLEDAELQRLMAEDEGAARNTPIAVPSGARLGN